MTKSKKISVEKMLKTLKEILELSCDVGDLQRASTIRSTIDLITQLHSDNERLVRENKTLSENADTAFQDGLNEAQDLYANQIRNEIRAETCKEFWEELKRRNTMDERIVSVASGDNLLKELVGKHDA